MTRIPALACAAVLLMAGSVYAAEPVETQVNEAGVAWLRCMAAGHKNEEIRINCIADCAAKPSPAVENCLESCDRAFRSESAKHQCGPVARHSPFDCQYDCEAAGEDFCRFCAHACGLPRKFCE